jgi:ammonia channel protein AmtB
LGRNSYRLFAHSSVNPAVIDNGLVFGETKLFICTDSKHCRNYNFGGSGTFIISLFIKYTMKFRVTQKEEAKA